MASYYTIKYVKIESPLLGKLYYASLGTICVSLSPNLNIPLLLTQYIGVVVVAVVSLQK